MYPSKNLFDYVAEMNRYSRIASENDLFQSSRARTNSYSQSTIAHSSSSTETSPDSFPDLTFPPDFRPEGARKPGFPRNPQWRPETYEHRPEYDLRPALEAQSTFEWNTHTYQPDINNLLLADVYDTTPTRRQRPIIGRKIMATDTLKTINEQPIWQSEHTPPKSDKYTNYELFPSQNRGFEFPSPIKTPPTQFRSPHTPLSPHGSITPPSRSPFSPRLTAFKEPLIGSSFGYGSSKMCTFCRKNGETPVVYMTHVVKEKVGNKNVVTCPILRSHVCSTCGASGDNAHTITYCPVLRSGNNGQPLQSTTITLKNTRIKSNGRRRF